MPSIKTKVKKIYSVCHQRLNKLDNKIIDKKLIAGLVIGITIAAGTSVVAEDAPNEEGTLSTLANFLGLKSSESTNPTSSVISKTLELEAQKCATAENGSLGASIKMASKIHLEIAAVAPPVEELFDGDCFTGLMSIFDLSFTIPSIASIISAATQAVIQFAQKKVCRAIKKASSMIADPINQAIGKINGLQGLTDGNGLINGMVQNGLSSIDKDLGNEYLAPKASETIMVEANAFNFAQAPVENGANSNNNSTNNINSGGQVSNTLYTNMNNLNSANLQMQRNYQEIISLNPRITQAEQAYNNCMNGNNIANNGGNNNCETLRQEHQNLLNRRQALETQNAQITNSISQGSYNVNIQNGVIVQNGNIISGTNVKSATNDSNGNKSGNGNDSSWFSFDWFKK
jgi:hypothetical protein